MIHIYTSVLTARVEYAFQLIFGTILNEEIIFHSDEETFSEAKGMKINYSANPDLDGFFLKPASLLCETQLLEQHLVVVDWEETKGFFPTEGSRIPFDIFAASFFLVTRYEEYLPGKRDHHQRFVDEEGFLVRNGLNEKPVVNIWAQKLARLIEKEYPEFRFQRSNFSYCPTIDIDNAFAFQHKGILRPFLAIIKDVVGQRWNLLGKRLKVYFHSEKDPYNNYGFLSGLFHQYSFKPTYFFLLNSNGKNDRSLSFRNLSFRKLIKETSKEGDVGIHPSYASNRNKKQLKKEIGRLHSILGIEVKFSRQHFLKMQFPDTYRNLQEFGISDDYTMGYPGHIGFRAGIATPYFFFDLLKNKTTNLCVHPFQVMDVTLANYLKMQPDDALAKIEMLLHETANVGGTFVSLWHNESLSEEGQWKGWKKVYSEMSRMAYNLTNDRKI